MKLKPSQIENFIESPSRKFHLILIHGNCAEEIRKRKNSLINNLGGQALLDEMRLVNLSEKEILGDKETLFRELKTKPFFTGEKIVLIENITDASFKVIQEIIQQKLTNEDAILVLVGNNLTTKSILRTLVENQDDSAVTLPLYKRDITTSEIKVMAEARGLKFIDETCFLHLKELSDNSESSILINTLDKLQLCFLNENIQLDVEHIEKIQEHEIAQNYFLIIENVANGNLPKTIKEFRRYATGKQNFSAFIAFLTRYFRNIQNVSSNPVYKTPYFGKTQEKFKRHVKLWPEKKVKKVIELLFNLNIKLRTTSRIDDHLNIERVLMNICSLIN